MALLKMKPGRVCAVNNTFRDMLLTVNSFSPLPPVPFPQHPPPTHTPVAVLLKLMGLLPWHKEEEDPIKLHCISQR